MGERRGGTNWPGPTNPHCQQRYLAIADPNQINLESSLFFAISTYFCVYFHICHVLCEWRIGYIDRAPTQVYNLFQMWAMGNAIHSTIHTWKFPELLIILHLFLCISMNLPLRCLLIGSKWGKILRRLKTKCFCLRYKKCFDVKCEVMSHSNKLNIMFLEFSVVNI